MEEIRKAVFDDFLKVQKWISDFKCNIKLVERSFNSDSAFVLTYENEIFGFATYYLNENIAKIDILEINKKLRKRGLGKKMVNKILEWFYINNIFAVYLECISNDSEKFWEKLHFKKMPFKITEGWAFESKYLILINHINQSPKDSNSLNFIKIFHEEIFGNKFDLCDDYSFWELGENNLKVNNPLIFPAKSDWSIIYCYNCKTIIEKVKRCNFQSPFVVIFELPV